MPAFGQDLPVGPFDQTAGNLPFARRGYRGHGVSPNRVAFVEMSAPTDRTRALETLLLRIRRANACLSNHDMWTDRAKEFATPDEIARMDADAAQATGALAACEPALVTLVATTRTDAPDELAAWVEAHDAYLVEFIADCSARGYAIDFPTAARAQWADVRAGMRAYVVDTGGVTETVPVTMDRYRTLFGIDPTTDGNAGAP